MTARPSKSPPRDWRMHAWPLELREEFEERAAIIEDGCRVTREEAETLAFQMLRERVRT